MMRGPWFFGGVPPEAKREAGEPNSKAGAAPATVSGEPSSDVPLGIAQSREGRTQAATREPGDLPRRFVVLGRGVPVGRLRSVAEARRTSACIRSAFAPNKGV